jgi:hypothetical protein
VDGRVRELKCYNFARDAGVNPLPLKPGTSKLIRDSIFRASPGAPG